MILVYNAQKDMPLLLYYRYYNLCKILTLFTWRLTGCSKKELVGPSGSVAGKVKRPFLHGDVYHPVTSLLSLHQQPSPSVGKGRGFLGHGQLLEFHPLAFAYLVLARVDVKGHRF